MKCQTGCSTRSALDYSNRRRLASKKMRNLGVTSIDQLIDVVQNAGENIKIRSEACSALGYLGTRKAVRALNQAKKHQDNLLRKSAMTALRRINRKFIADMIGPQRRLAGRMMRKLRAKTPKELVQILDNKSETAARRSMSCLALGALREKDGVPSILRAMQENQPNLVWVAANAVVTVCDKQIAKKIITIIERSQYETSRQAAIYAIGFIGDEGAIKVLKRVLNDPTKNSCLTRSLAAEAIGSLDKTGKYLPTLFKVVREDLSVEVKYSGLTAIAIHRYSQPKVIRFLEKCRDDRSISPTSSIAILVRKILAKN